MAISNPGGNLNTVPAPTKQTQNSNYLDLTGTTASTNWAQQYVPDLMEKEAEVFGNRTVSGFLSQVGAEESMTADQVVWSEQGRLHLSYKGHIADHQNQDNNNNEPGGTLEIDTNIDGVAVSRTVIDHGVRVNDLNAGALAPILPSPPLEYSEPYTKHLTAAPLAIPASVK